MSPQRSSTLSESSSMSSSSSDSISFVQASPDDLRRELEKNEQAREFFSGLDARNRYAILYQIQDAKKPETRARRIAKYAAMLAEQKKPYP